MIRQVVFGVVLGLAQASGSPGQIPISRLTAEATLPIRLAPGAVASDDAVWLRDGRDGTVVRVGGKDNTVSAPVSIGGQPCGSLVAAFASVWVPSCGDRAVVRINPADLKVTAKADVAIADADGRLATGIGSLGVVADRKGGLARNDPDTTAPRAFVDAVYADRATMFAAVQDAVRRGGSLFGEGGLLRRQA